MYVTYIKATNVMMFFFLSKRHIFYDTEKHFYYYSHIKNQTSVVKVSSLMHVYIRLYDIIGSNNFNFRNKDVPLQIKGSLTNDASSFFSFLRL